MTATDLLAALCPRCQRRLVRQHGGQVIRIPTVLPIPDGQIRAALDSGRSYRAVAAAYRIGIATVVRMAKRSVL